MAIATVVLPDVDRSLTDHFERQVARVPDRAAVAGATHSAGAPCRAARSPLDARRGMIDLSR